MEKNILLKIKSYVIQGKIKFEYLLEIPKSLPAIYIEGDVIKSDVGWLASNFVNEMPAGWSNLYLKKRSKPNIF